MGNRQVVLVLNVTDLIKLAMRGKRRSVLDVLTESVSSETAQTQREILVVDDSITTRTLEKNILEAAGYEVQLATDGMRLLSIIYVGIRKQLLMLILLELQMVLA
jgi:two-component system chemotaxis sensor kinase CheA